MGQIHGWSMGSPAAIVTTAAELLVTGSMSSTEDGMSVKSVYDGTSAMKLKNQNEEIIYWLEKIHTQLSYMTGEELNKGG